MILKKIVLYTSCFVLSGMGFAATDLNHSQRSALMPEHLVSQEPTLAIDVLPVLGEKAIWHVESHQNPIVSFSLVFQNAGSKGDPDHKKGVSSFLSSLLEEGCGELSSLEVKKYLLKYNIELYVSGEQDTFSISFRCPKDSVRQAFDLMKLMLTKPRFDKAPFERVRHQMVQSYEAALVNDRQRAGEVLSQVLYGDHIYAKSYENLIRESKFIAPEDLHLFMKERFALDQVVLASVGDLTKEEVLAFVKDLLSALPKQSKPLDVKDVALKNLGEIKRVELDVPQSVIRFAQPGIKRKDPDFYAAYVAEKILADGSFESRLWNSVREKSGLAYYCSADLQWSDHVELISGVTATNSQNVDQVITLIKQEWQGIIDSGVTQEELDFVKGRLIGSFALNFDSTLQILSALILYQRDGLTPNFIKERNTIIQNLTLEKVNEVAKKLFNPNTLTFVVVGK
ncbi:MAG TPA: pitrilysin family protein [Alphaproteobacteria bacterium]|nr:pitrilysin family protein [Alphaproteobacteria bacterium]